MSEESPLTLKEVAAGAGVSPGTLRRWVSEGLIPMYRGEWTSAAAAQARFVARLRERGNSIAEIRAANAAGRMAFGYVEEVLPGAEGTYTLEEAARLTGLEPALIERIYATIGFATLTTISDVDVEMLRQAAAALNAGFPLVAFLQLVRVYGQALAQIATAEVRLFRIYVHEPMLRDGVPPQQIARQMETLARDLLPLSQPIMEQVHARLLAHFAEQEVIAVMEAGAGEDGTLDIGRMRVAIAFIDLAGYTRLTEEVGDERAVGTVERFVEAVEHTLPEGARVIKTLGDEVMVVGADLGALTTWAVRFAASLDPDLPAPRIGLHYGETLYRDGDYYGREVNRAARLVARAAGGEVMVTRPVVDGADGDVRFEWLGEIRLKGFTELTDIFLAAAS